MKSIFLLLISGLIFLSGFGVVGETCNKAIIENKVSTEFIIDGPTEGKIGTPYAYTFYLSPNSECDVFWMNVYWGQGFGWGNLGPYPTGVNNTLINCWHRFWWEPNPMTFIIQASAFCNNSEYYAELEVIMWEKGKIIQNIIFIQLLEQFPILQKILLLQR
jgi:hypothetical protein